MNPRRSSRLPSVLCIVAAAIFIAGCTTVPRNAALAPTPTSVSGPFVFGRDTFGFPNETLFHYGPPPNPDEISDEIRAVLEHVRRQETGISARAANGGGNFAPSQNRPKYFLYCFLMSRVANQVHRFARFEPDAPRISERAYAARLGKIARMPVWWEPLPDEKRVVIPGYADFHSFSAENETLVKRAIGHKWQSVWRVGNWKMVHGSTPERQKTIAEFLKWSVARGVFQQIHITDWPTLDLNHSVLVVQCVERNGKWYFVCYDPNEVAQPLVISYDPETAQFSMPHVGYYHGGPIWVHRTYYTWFF
jgi:hypothetical protein